MQTNTKLRAVEADPDELAEALAVATTACDEATRNRDAAQKDHEDGLARLAALDRAVSEAAPRDLDSILRDRAMQREKIAELEVRASARQAALAAASDRLGGLARRKSLRALASLEAELADVLAADVDAIHGALENLRSAISRHTQHEAELASTRVQITGDPSTTSGVATAAEILRAYSLRQGPGGWAEVRIPVGR